MALLGPRNHAAHRAGMRGAARALTLSVAALCLLLLTVLTGGRGGHSPETPVQFRHISSSPVVPPFKHAEDSAGSPVSSPNPTALLLDRLRALAGATDDDATLSELLGLTRCVMSGDDTQTTLLLSLAQDPSTEPRLAGFCILLACLTKAPASTPRLVEIALGADEIRSLCAVCGLLIVHSPRWQMEASDEDILAFWNGAFLDFGVGDLLRPGYTERADRAGQISGESMPDSPWWSCTRWTADPTLGDMLLGVAVSGRAVQACIFALQSVQPGERKDLAARAIAANDAAPPLLKAVAYESLSPTEANRSFVIDGLRRETHPRILAGLAVKLREWSTLGPKTESLRVLEAVLQDHGDHEAIADRATSSISLIDVEESIEVLTRLAKRGESEVVRLAAARALAKYPADSKTVESRTYSLTDLTWSAGGTVSALAGLMLLSIEREPGLAKAQMSIVTPDLLGRIETLAASASVREDIRTELRRVLSDRQARR